MGISKPLRDCSPRGIMARAPMLLLLGLGAQLLQPSDCLWVASLRPARSLRAPSPRAQVGVSRDIQPLRDNVLVEISTVPVATAMGILLPTMYETDDDFDVARDLEVRKGTVLAVGPGSFNQKGELTPVTNVKPGDTVIVGPRGGVKLQEAGKTVAESSLYMFTADQLWSRLDMS
ncbi:hypothetical protein AB1Y20_006235 [Prymnesium parvum]|uniref:10 kDa chaperonin n=1 Tax=Prymnesium parvum TaxID=97485 RepID=A0AB34J3E5_PRYPA